MRVKYLLIALVVLFAIGILVSPGYAKIGPETIVGIWLLDEGIGDLAKDSSGNGYHGKVPEKAQWVEGKFGKALEFDGSGYVVVPHHDNLSLETYSLLAWVKVPKPTGVWGGIILKRASPDLGYGIWVRPDSGTLHNSHKLAGRTNQIVESITTVTDGEWHHVAGTYDLNVSKAYVDGILEAEKPFSDKPNVSDIPFTIGGGVIDFNIVGVIDEAAAFSVALSEGDIKDIMNNGLSIMTAVESSGRLSTTWAGIKAK